MDLQNVSLGFDIATAISIIGAAVTYIVNIKKENKRQSLEAREHERIINLSKAEEKYHKIFDTFTDHASKGETNEALNSLKELYDYCHLELRHDLAAYGTKNNLAKLEKIVGGLRDKLTKVKEVYTSGQFGPDKNNTNLGAILTEIIKPNQLVNSLIELDMNLLIQLRSLLNDEAIETTTEIIKEVAKNRWSYPLSEAGFKQ